MALTDFTLIEKTKDFNKFCQFLMNEKYISLDVETAMYTNPPRLCLIQISTEEHNWICDPLKIIDISAIQEVLENKSIIKIIHNASFEKRVFKQYGYEIENVFDTLAISRKIRGMKISGGHTLQSVCSRELDVKMDKSQQCSNWILRPLSQRQLDYAYLDSKVLIDLYAIFTKELNPNI